MNLLCYVADDQVLIHHGIKGQKWGIRNGPPYPLQNNHNFGKKLLKNAYGSNLNNWGKDKNHNTCYITSYSGSGKSTLALYLQEITDAEIIHLDPYTEKFEENHNKNFDKLLASRFPEYFKLKQKEFVRNGKLLDKFQECLEEYARLLYPSRKLIVEGIQLLDETFYPDKKYFADKPLLIPSTSARTSSKRGSARDGVQNANEEYEKHKTIYDNSIKTIQKMIKDYNMLKNAHQSFT